MNGVAPEITGAAPVSISGAGPAGLAAAVTLARAGVKTVVHEFRQDVGARFHGDFQGIENWTTPGDVLEVGFLGSIVYPLY